jgi:hypothetical protein
MNSIASSLILAGALRGYFHNTLSVQVRQPSTPAHGLDTTPCGPLCVQRLPSPGTLFPPIAAPFSDPLHLFIVTGLALLNATFIVVPRQPTAFRFGLC